jgi:hypothetical protein
MSTESYRTPDRPLSPADGYRLDEKDSRQLLPEYRDLEAVTKEGDAYLEERFISIPPRKISPWIMSKQVPVAAGLVGRN